MSETRGDEYVFHFFMSNRLSNRFPGRGAKAYAPCAFIVYTHALCRAFGGAYAIRPLPCRKKIRFPRVCVFHCLGQCWINTRFIPSCLIGYQIGTHVGAYCIRPLRVYRLPLRPLRGVWWGVCNTPLHCRKKMRFHRICVFYCLGQSETNTYFILSCPIGYQIDTRVGAYCIRPLRVYRLSQRPLWGVW